MRRSFQENARRRTTTKVLSQKRLETLVLTWTSMITNMLILASTSVP